MKLGAHCKQLLAEIKEQEQLIDATNDRVKHLEQALVSIVGECGKTQKSETFTNCEITPPHNLEDWDGY